jgi:hypothetical protein
MDLSLERMVQSVFRTAREVDLEHHSLDGMRLSLERERLSFKRVGLRPPRFDLRGLASPVRFNPQRRSFDRKARMV